MSTSKKCFRTSGRTICSLTCGCIVLELKVSGRWKAPGAGMDKEGRRGRGGKGFGWIAQLQVRPYVFAAEAPFGNDAEIAKAVN